MMNSFGALHKYDLEIQFNRRDLYQTSAFCGHVFTMKLLLKKITLGHMTKNKCGYQMHIFVTSFSKQHAPVWRCFCMVQPLRQPFRPKCTNRILQMHQQNPVVPSESGVHPQNPVCTYSVGCPRGDSKLHHWSWSWNVMCGFVSVWEVDPESPTVTWATTTSDVTSGGFPSACALCALLNKMATETE